MTMVQSVSGVSLGAITCATLSLAVKLDPHGYSFSERSFTLITIVVVSVTTVGVGILIGRILFKIYAKLSKNLQPF